MTRGVGCWSWIKKSGSAHLEPTGYRQFAEAACFQPPRQADLRPRGSGRWSGTMKKSGSAHLEPTGLRQFAEAACFQPHRQADLRPRGSGRWSWTLKKSGRAHLEPTGLWQLAEAACFQRLRLADLRPRGSGRWSWTMKKSGSARYVPQPADFRFSIKLKKRSGIFYAGTFFGLAFFITRCRLFGSWLSSFSLFSFI